MKEDNLARVSQSGQIQIAQTQVMTGDRDKRRFLYYQLARSMENASQIDVIVSFLMESGVRMLLKDFKKATGRGVKIRILTGNYLGITQPSALYLVKHELGDSVDIRFYSEKERSFHPKSYIFHYKDHSDIYIGSSNISKSALTSGIEWNYCFSSDTDRPNYEQFYQTFEDLFYHHSIPVDDRVLKEYSKNWHRPAAAKDLDRYDESEEETLKITRLYEPRGAQIEALCALENTRAEGAEKALVTAATGIGKTALAAFDSRGYERVLFVAHREEILRQASETFANIRESDDYGFFDGTEKCIDMPVIFANVATLGNERYLNEKYFAPDSFQYLIIDEVHHGVTTQYQRIVNYFKPQFLLGLTATPERMDGRSIYEICDYNVPYENSMQEAINKGMLSPFHYYGIYDETDYSSVRLVRGRYDENELTDVYLRNEKRFDLIYKYYAKYVSKRALGFCCSRAHAEKMAEEFTKRGVPSVAVYSNAEGAFAEKRDKAIRKLRDGKIKVIFCVDMFNEGVDIHSVDMVMFLRPTESPVVFMQQLGRGLRRDKGKAYLNVLDFIGNYEKAGLVRQFLTGRLDTDNGKTADYEKAQIPDDCIIDFDMRLIDLFRELDKRRIHIKEQIRNEYERIEELLEKRPSRMDLFTHMDGDLYGRVLERARENLFKHYLDYLDENGDLSEEEKDLCNTIAKDFLHEIETTDMTKVYKMPVLMAFYNGGDVRMDITEEEVLESWKRFFSTGTNWKDIDPSLTYQEYCAISDQKHLKKIMEMPVHFLQKSGKGFFVRKKGKVLSLRKELAPVIQNKAFAEHFGDIIQYRAMDYYKRRYLKSNE